MKNNPYNSEFLENALKQGNNAEGSFHQEETIRNRIGHNMKTLLMAYCIDLGKKPRPGVH
jgi:hypothetical protein